MRVRDWTGADHYRVLGVKPTATRDEITSAYRAQARVLHPDAGPTDPAAEEQFVRVSAAYQILTGPQREEYDRARRRGQVAVTRPAPAPTAPGAPVTKPWHLSRKGARGALGGGLALMVAGVLAAIVVTTLMVRDAHLRSDGIAVRAIVIRQAGEPRLEFVTRSGDVVRTDVPDAKSGGLAAGDIVDVRYDRGDPTRVVTESHSVARDITLWIIAVKLLIVGAVLTVVGARRLLRRDG